MKWYEALTLPYLALKVRLLESLWDYQIKKRYKRFSKFLALDEALRLLYRNENPYKICHEFFISKGIKTPFPYGETPLLVYDQIVKKWVSSQDSWIELGCGRGRGLFFISQVFSIHCIGIDYVSDFVKKARDIIDRFSVTKIDVEEMDFTQVAAIKGDIIYLYGTGFDDETIFKICETIISLKKQKIKVITVSYSLSEYDSRWEISDTFEARFAWGKGTVFLNRLAY